MVAQPRHADRFRPPVLLTHRRLAMRHDPTRPRKPYVIRTIATGWIGQRFLHNCRRQVGFTREQLAVDPRGAALMALSERFPGAWIVFPRPPRQTN